jgi:adenylate cyclase
MKKTVLLLIVLLVSGNAFCQVEGYRKKTDSLLKVLVKAKEDTVKVKLLNMLAKNYCYQFKMDMGLMYGNKALQLATRLKWKRGIMLSHISVSNAYGYQSDLKKEREYGLKALKEAHEIGDKNMEATICQSLGNSYSGDDYAVAISYFNRGLKIYKKRNDIDNYNAVLLQLGGMYSIKGKYYEAADCFRAIMKSGEKRKSISDIINGSNYLAGIYMQQGNNDKALEYYLKVLEKLDEIKNESVFTAIVLNDIGNIYSGKQQYDKALRYYNRALGYIRKSSNKNAETDCLLKISGIYKKLKNKSKAKLYFDNAIATTEADTYKIGRMDGYMQLGEFEFSDSNFKAALDYHLAALKLCEELQLKQEGAKANGNVGATYVRLAQETGNKEYAQNAATYLSHAIKDMKALENITMLQTYSEYLSEAYEVKGEAAKALSAYKEYIVYRDSVYDKTKRDEFSNKQSEYEYGKKEALLKATQYAEMQREKTVRNFSFAGIGVLIVVASGAGYAYNRKRKDNKIIAYEKQRSEDLLLNILPHEIAEELKANGEAAAQHYAEVSVLFTDFVGFTQLSEKMSAAELIGELNYCFKAFDAIITKYNIEKIKTIGDAYMAASGLPGKSPDHALNMVQAALDMREFMRQYKALRQEEGREYFEMRIGINSGEVVAGIVGVKKFAYDIWGDTVNIAARMESSGQKDKVNISETTYELIKNRYVAEFRGEIEAKGKGKIKMYFIEPGQENPAL